MNMPPAPVTEYSGFDLALGSVFAVRWFRPDQYGRLHAINYKHVWKPGCRCGFYAFAEDCDSGEYVVNNAVRGVVECYGRTIVGTRGLRCEKARVVALLTDRADIKRAYPDVRFFDPGKKRRLRRSNAAEAMLAAFDLVQPFTPDPETDPDFWERP